MASVLGLAAFAYATPVMGQNAGPSKTRPDDVYIRKDMPKDFDACIRPLSDIDYLEGCPENAWLNFWGSSTHDFSSSIELYHNSNKEPERAGSVGIISNSNGGQPGYIAFANSKGGGEWQEQMRITSGGNVGIGTSWPSDRFVVNGTVRGTNFRLDPNGVWTWGGFGGAGFGLDRGYYDLSGNNADAPNFSGQTLSAANTPVLLQGLSGVGIATENARMALNANGSICMGFGTQDVLPVAALASNSNQVLGNSLFLKKGLTAFNNPQFIISNEEAGARLELYSKDAAPGRKGNIGLITRTDNGSVGDFDLVSQNGSSYRSNLSVKADGTTSINGNTTVNGELVVKNGTGNQFKVNAIGEVRARRVQVDLATIPDYVFEPTYNLMPLAELNTYIKDNKHLPNIPSAKEYEERGSIDVSELNLKLLEKIEELTLYLLKQQEQIEEMKKMIANPKK